MKKVVITEEVEEYLNSLDVEGAYPFSDEVAKELGLDSIPEMLVTSTEQGGKAHINRGFYTVPRWAFGLGEAYAKAYIIHELCHFRVSGHAQDFKSLETKTLAKWGMIPDYSRKKDYISRLLDTAGNVLYE